MARFWVCQTINICSQATGAANGRTNRAQQQFVRVTALMEKQRRHLRLAIYAQLAELPIP